MNATHGLTVITSAADWGAPQLSPAQRQQLFEAARAAREQAYAPYSNFLVGVALLDDAARIHAGCNVENAAYPQGVCAEAGAISAMCLSGGRRIQALLVVGHAMLPSASAKANERPWMTEDGSTQWVTPCGGCRQKIREFARPDTPILLASPTSWLATVSLQQLLPFSFGPQQLGT